MNKLIIFSFLIFIVFKLDSQAQNQKNAQRNNTNCKLVAPSPNLDLKEIDFLLKMYEEEKLARDVYVSFYNKYNIEFFKNTSQAQQIQMNQIACLLKHYNLKYKATEREGIFNDLNIQQHYFDFKEQGDISVSDAIKASATIEDLNLFDLGEYMSFTKNPAILAIFKHLSCGAKNHLRNFVNVLKVKNETYLPKHITEKEYKRIVKKKNEKCTMNANPTNSGQGKGQGKGSGQGKGQGRGQGRGMNY